MEAIRELDGLWYPTTALQLSPDVQCSVVNGYTAQGTSCLNRFGCEVCVHLVSTSSLRVLTPGRCVCVCDKTVINKACNTPMTD